MSLYPGDSLPATPSETIVLYAVGLGLPSTTLARGIVNADRRSGLPVSSGPGLYQLNVTIPSTAANGDNTITCTYGGSSTPSSDLITVQR